MPGIDSQFYNYFKQIQQEHLSLGTVTTMQWEGMLSAWNLGQIKDYVLILEEPDVRPTGITEGHPTMLVTAAFTVAHKAKVGAAAENAIIKDEIHVIIIDIISKIWKDIYPVRDKDFFIQKLNDDFNIISTLPLNSRTFIGKRCQFSFVAKGGVKYDENRWQ